MKFRSGTKRVVIVGGGISGLACAHKITELMRSTRTSLEVVVLEGKSRLGGVLETHRQGNIVFEAGAESFVSDKPWGVDLVNRLGLQEQLQNTESKHRRSFILHGRDLVSMPRGFYLISPAAVGSLLQLRHMSLPGRLRMGLEPLIPKRNSSKDESVADFIRRRFGREALAKLGQPMLAGIYSGDPESLSLAATFPQFSRMEQECGSVMRALAKAGQSTGQASGPRYSLFLTLRGGMSSLIEGLLQAMPEAEFRTGCNVTQLQTGSRWRIHIGSDRPLEADAVCLALPAHASERLVAPLDTPLAHLLHQIPYESVATLNLLFERKAIHRPLNGFGFVVPNREGRALIGCTFSSIKFSGRCPGEQVLLRAFVGGAFRRGFCNLDDDIIEETVLAELGDILDIREPPVQSKLTRFDQAMPQYNLNHLSRVGRIESRLARIPGLFLAGNGFRGVGIPDCIRYGEQTAKGIFQFLLSEKAGQSAASKSRDAAHDN